MNKISNKLRQKISKYHNLSQNSTFIFKTKNSLNIKTISNKYLRCILNLENINNVRRVNKFHEAINKNLNDEDIYVSCGETLEQRRVRIKKKTLFGFKNIIRTVDFFYKRVLPKLPIIKNIYFFITKGHNRVMSKTEILGRLISCGFEVLEYFEYQNILYVISRKIKPPEYNMNVSYGLLFKMNRIGYNNNMIGVYKFRTMYPYSEYCQDLITKQNSLSDTGKIADDFRVTTWGKVMRKFWIDELPNLINFFKREMKLIGVRPISKNYFNKFPKNLQNLRIRTKPSCIGIHYSIIPQKKEDVVELEIKYLEKYFKNPLKTDIKYFYYFLYNIFFKGVRSK